MPEAKKNIEKRFRTAASAAQEPKRLFILCFFVAAIITALWHLGWYFNDGYSTDDVAQQVILQTAELGDGYSAKMPAAGYIVLKTPLYLLLDALLPNGSLSIFIAAYSLFTAGLAFTFAAFYLLSVRLALLKPAIAALGLVAVTATPPVLAVLVNPNYRNIEVGLCILIITLLLVYLQQGIATLKQELAAGILAALLLAVFLFNDPTFVYYLLVPVALIAVYTLLSKPRVVQARSFKLLLCLAAAYVLYRCIPLLTETYLEYSVAPTIGGLVTDPAKLYASFLVSIQSFFVLGNARFWLVGAVSVEQLQTFANFLFLMAGSLISILLFAREAFKRKDANPFVLLFTGLPLYVMAVLVVSGTAVDGGSSRYLFLLPYGLVFAYARAWTLLSGGDRLQRYAKPAITVILGATVVTGFVAAGSYALARPTAPPNQKERQVVRYLEEYSLKKGYAPSGVSLYLSYISQNKITTISTYCNAKKLGIFYRLIDESMLAKPAQRSFYYYDKNSISNACSLEETIARIGQPDTIVPVTTEAFLLIYESEDIKDRVRGKR